MHRAAPLQVAGLDETFPEAGRGAEVGREHGVAAVGQQLVDTVIAIIVAAPGPAMDEQDERNRRIRAAVTVGICARR